MIPSHGIIVAAIFATAPTVVQGKTTMVGKGDLITHWTRP